MGCRDGQEIPPLSVSRILSDSKGQIALKASRPVSVVA